MLKVTSTPLQLRILKQTSRDARVKALSNADAIQIAKLSPIVIAASVLALQSRPRGWCNRRLIEARPSAIHNIGVFAKTRIMKGTALGSYPGFQKSAAVMNNKVLKYPAAKGYVFGSEQGWYLDPTDAEGKANLTKLWGLADTTLAFVNEPSVGQDTNVSIEGGASDLEILFVANRNIYTSEEILVDYGRTYNRSAYR